MSDCQHEIGRKAIGGIPGHEHYHPTGNQLCLNCGRYLHEILSDERADERARLREKVRRYAKNDAPFTEDWNNAMAYLLGLLEEPGETGR